MDVRVESESGVYGVRLADVAELVEVYTRQLLCGELFLPLEKLPGGDAVDIGTSCSVEIELPDGSGGFAVEALLSSVSEQPPRGVRLRIAELDAALRAALERYITARLRGELPEIEPPLGPCVAQERLDVREHDDAVDRAGDAALAFQEEATGRAADGRSIQAQLREMSHQDRIRLALSGGKAARAALIRNPQPVYHPYVVQNPRITPAELATMAKNPNVAPDALRMIAANAQHMSDPTVRLNIVKNPKTDPQVALKFLARLSQAQLRQLARSDDVRPHIKSAALRLVNRSSR